MRQDREGPEFSKPSRKLFSLLLPRRFWLLCYISFANGECFAQRRLPTRTELLGDFGIRHDDVEPVEGTTHDQEFRCDSGMDEPARVLHAFFDEQVKGTDDDEKSSGRSEGRPTTRKTYFIRPPFSF
jgi:hypothetical protein